MRYAYLISSVKQELCIIWHCMFGAQHSSWPTMAIQRKSLHQRTISLLANDLTVYLTEMNVSCGTLGCLLLPSFQRKIVMSSHFPQSCFEEEVSLILSNVPLHSSVLDIKQSYFSCTLLINYCLSIFYFFVSFRLFLIAYKWACLST